MAGPYTVQRIRLLLQSPTSQPSDQLSSGGSPSFEVGTGIQFEIARALNNVLIDASQIASVTLAIKPSNNEDSAAIISATVTPTSAGWNSNAIMTAGQSLVPSYAAYAAAGTAATATANITSNAVSSLSIGSGGTGYTVAPIVFFVGGGGSGASYTATISGGIVTGFVKISGGTGYTSAPMVVLIPPPSSYVLGVQQGAIYTWTIGNNDVALSNSGTLVVGSNVVPSGVSYAGGNPYTYSLTGLTANTFYGYFLGANDLSVSGTGVTVGTAFFLTSSATTSATLNGSGVESVTMEVYQAAAGSNLISGAASYAASTLVSSGTNISTGNFTTSTGATTTTYSAAISGQSYGTAVLKGLTPGTTYAYQLGSADLSINGVPISTAQTGLFTTTTSTVLLTGTPGATITAQAFTTIGAASTYGLTGLTNGQTYYWTKGANDISCGSLTQSGFFVATSGQATLTGNGGSSVSALLQQITIVTSSSFIAASNSVTFTGYPSLAVTATLTGNVGWNQTSDQLCVIPFAASQTNLSTPDGGTTTYWMLITAVTTSGSPIVLGSGQIVAVDSGQASGTPATNNIVPSNATYSSGGSYSLTVTPGFVYYWSPGANDTGAPGLSAAGTFYATSSTATLTGTGSASVTATVYAVNQRPYVGIATLTANQTVLTTSLVLPYTPMGGTCSVMIPSSAGTPIDAPLDYSTIGTTGGTFRFNVPIPASGYIAIYTFY